MPATATNTAQTVDTQMLTLFVCATEPSNKIAAIV